MTRQQLEHIIRASASIADTLQIMVVGSQSILGAFPAAPPELVESMEADVYPLHAPKLAEIIDGTIGEGSMFHESYGYYAQGVGPDTATLPGGWENRVVALEIGQVTGYCLEPHDLAASKLVAGRDKDKPFVSAMLQHGLIQGATLTQRLATLPIDAEHRERLRLWLRAELAHQQAGSGPGAHRGSARGPAS